ncbi:MAG: hypothetical protein H6832_15090 [Planctomycetes bacterium]|nr:hypothetical protein [Planctomycetota bacterium]
MKPARPFSLLFRHCLCTVVGSSLLGLCASLPAQDEAPIPNDKDSALLQGLHARSIGPAGMSGRVTALAARDDDPDTIFVGAASGGLWRTENAGMTWTPLFDEQKVASIGAIALDPKHPQRIWVGTGEAFPRNSVASGDGLYRSDDAGTTWTHLGLRESERIGNILVSETDSDTAWIGVVGKAWGPGDERGVYKTTDGGKTLRRVLHVDDRTGCADLVQHPQDPNTLFAAMWSFRRRPYDFVSGGKGSGLWRSHDGGETWTRLEAKDGLPKGELGRIGIAIARSNPDVVYALVEAKKSALLRSDDGGRSFRTVHDGEDASPRPFYYSRVLVDPKNADRVYRLGSTTSVSNDGGKTFQTLAAWSLVHPDHHAMWIAPHDPEFLIDGNDGGVAISRDHGKTWRFVRNLPLAQYYHIAVDDDQPYHVYGGMQDNGSWRGPTRVFENGGIRNHHWQELFFGDGFATIPDPQDSRIGYAMSQGGALGRWNRITGERKTIRPFAPTETVPTADGTDTETRNVKLRFNWNAAIALDPFDPAGVYYGSQFVHYSGDRGDSWKVLSPDLTSDTKAWQKQYESGGLTYDVTGAENYCTLMTIAPSPVQQGVVWSGSDDGRVHVTTNGGATWTRVDEAIDGLEPFSWCTHIEASKFDATTAWAVFDDHRRSNTKAYVFETKDFGKSWRSIVPADFDGPCLTIEQDPVDASLLFVGTEHGLWISRNGGGKWTRFEKKGLPTVAVPSLVVHPTHHDLVIGTHGRAAYVIDDIRPLRNADAWTSGEVALLTPQPAIPWEISQTGESRFPGSEEFRGENRAYGAILALWIGPKAAEQLDEKKVAANGAPNRDNDDPASGDAQGAAESGGSEADRGDAANQQGETKQTPSEDEAANRAPFALEPGEVELVIERAVEPDLGRRVRVLRTKVKPGHNRIVWDLREDPARPGKNAKPGSGGGMLVLPGRYRVHTRIGEFECETHVDVLPDPRLSISESDRRAKYDAIRNAEGLASAMRTVFERIDSIRADTKAMSARLDELRQLRAHETRLADNEEVARTLPSDESLAEAQGRCKAFDKKLKAIEERFRVPRGSVQGIADRDTLASRVFEAISRLQSSRDAPSPQQLDAVDRVTAELRPALEAWNRFEQDEVKALRDQVQPLLQWLTPRPPIRIR